MSWREGEPDRRADEAMHACSRSRPTGSGFWVWQPKMLRCGTVQIKRSLRRSLVLVLLFSSWLPGTTLLARQLSTAPAQLSEDSPPEKLYVRKIHSFWDRENVLLFAGVGAARAIDYSSTLNMRRRGRQEIFLNDWIVDHHGLFAGVEAGGTAVSIGVSYWFHRTGHHQLERWASFVHIGMTTTGAVRNYSLKTRHSIVLPSIVAEQPSGPP